MSGLEDLTAMIYHERQQSGSMLCAQHALNSLLQGNYFTAIDLADIAQRFDALEREALGDSAPPNSSGNMDDTGFFSVQVMDRALDVWGLDLIRWRSPQMRPFADAPHKQLAFVLNLHQHWFTLRRFGPATNNFETDAGEGVWFNLNSQYPRPKWVSKTYLGMFLQQCEEEGYSVFAVVQHDRSQPLSLPRTEADQAAALAEAPDSLPDHSSNTMPGSFPEGSGSDEHEQIVIPDDIEYDVNNEDVELQAALAASLAGTETPPGSGAAFGQHSYVPQAPVPAPPLRQAPEPPSTAENAAAMSMDVDEADPVAASAARNRALLEHMQRMQEEALRGGFDGEEDDAAAERRRAREAREREEEEELQRAIRESMKDHENVASTAPAPGDTMGADTPTMPDRNQGSDRVYDDEDSELQAALRASLEAMPEGFVHVTPPPAPAPARPSASTAVTTESEKRPTEVIRSGESVDTEASTEEEGASSPPAPAQELDRDEIRRARLARFGG